MYVIANLQHDICKMPKYCLFAVCVGRYFLDLTRTDVHWNLVQDSGWAKVAWSSVFGPWSQGACVFVHQMDNPGPEKVLRVGVRLTHLVDICIFTFFVLVNLSVQ